MRREHRAGGQRGVHRDHPAGQAGLSSARSAATSGRRNSGWRQVAGSSRRGHGPAAELLVPVGGEEVDVGQRGVAGPAGGQPAQPLGGARADVGLLLPGVSTGSTSASQSVSRSSSPLPAGPPGHHVRRAQTGGILFGMMGPVRASASSRHGMSRSKVGPDSSGASAAAVRAERPAAPSRPGRSTLVRRRRSGPMETRVRPGRCGVAEIRCSSGLQTTSSTRSPWPREVPAQVGLQLLPGHRRGEGGRARGGHGGVLRWSSTLSYLKMVKQLDGSCQR